MKKILFGLAVAGFVFGIAGLAVAAETAADPVTITVAAINEITVSGSASFNVTIGSQLNTPLAMTGTPTFAVTTNAVAGAATQKRITASTSAIPAGMTLTATLAATTNTGALSAGIKTLSIAAVDMVTVIHGVQDTGRSITYTLTVTPTALVTASTTITVTYTILI